VSAGSAQRAGRGAAGRGVEAGAQETAGTRVKAAESKVRRAAKAAAAAAAAGRVERHPAARQCHGWWEAAVLPGSTGTGGAWAGTSRRTFGD
jgi:hypothetical protein